MIKHEKLLTDILKKDILTLDEQRELITIIIGRSPVNNCPFREDFINILENALNRYNVPERAKAKGE